MPAIQKRPRQFIRRLRRMEADSRKIASQKEQTLAQAVADMLSRKPVGIIGLTSVVLDDDHSKSYLKACDRMLSITSPLRHDTLLVVMEEFGRTPKLGNITSNAGAAANRRDHWLRVT